MPIKERYNRAASFDPHELNPALKGILVNGQPVYGAADFINTSQWPPYSSSNGYQRMRVDIDSHAEPETDRARYLALDREAKP